MVHRQITTTEEISVKNSGSRRRAEPTFVMTSNGKPLGESIEQVPDERLDQFLRFIARLLVRDLRDYPELPGDSGTTN